MSVFGNINQVDPITPYLNGRNARRQDDIMDLQQNLAQNPSIFNPAIGKLAAYNADPIKAFTDIPLARQKAMITDAKKGLSFLENGQPEKALEIGYNRLADLAKVDNKAVSKDTMMGIQSIQEEMLQNEVAAEQGAALPGYPKSIAMLKTIADLDTDKLKGYKGTGQIEYEQLVKDSQSSDPAISEPAKIKLKLIPGAGTTTGKERILGPDGQPLRDAEVEHAGNIAGSKESNKQREILKFKGLIQHTVTLAEAAAKEKGEVLTHRARMSAALPQLKTVVAQLRELAPLVTNTMAGHMWDSIVKESGFGATKGKTAKAKYTAIIQNQVLPLLRPTFGAAFTVEEVKRLEATMGDVNATEDEKMAALDAFIEQQEYKILNDDGQLDDMAKNNPYGQPSANQPVNQQPVTNGPLGQKDLNLDNDPYGLYDQ